MKRASRIILTAVWLAVVAAGAGSASGSHTAQHRYLTEQKNRQDIPAHYQSMTFAEFRALPVVPERYTTSDWETVRTQTQLSVSLEGYIAEVLRAADGATYGRPPEQGDFHVHLREAKVPHCWPAGPQNQQIVTEITPHFQPPRTGWSYETLRDLCQRQFRVRISGWLLHDYPHLKDVGDWRASAWEIHPVMNIERKGRAEWRKKLLSNCGCRVRRRRSRRTLLWMSSTVSGARFARRPYFR